MQGSWLKNSNNLNSFAPYVGKKKILSIGFQIQSKSESSGTAKACPCLDRRIQFSNVETSEPLCVKLALHTDSISAIIKAFDCGGSRVKTLLKKECAAFKCICIEPQRGDASDRLESPQADINFVTSSNRPLSEARRR